MNFYIFDMCYRNNIELEKVNEIGHKFDYNLFQAKGYETDESPLFALSVQE